MKKVLLRYLNIPKGVKKGACLLNLLRRQGNFSTLHANSIRPVQRLSSMAYDKNITRSDFLPCKYCKGLYKKNSLSRHAKKCHFNVEEKGKQIRYKSEAQTVLAFTGTRENFLNRLRLKTEVFHTMHADRASLNGKKDPIVCQYAEDYLRRHKRPHIKTLISNKVRELGRLLIPLQDLYQINSMLEALRPENFDKVVAAGRIISGYNEETKSFKAPSLALHLRTILLAVCSSARTLLFKKDPVLCVTDYDQVLSDLDKIEVMVSKNWKFEMGSLALKDLNEKHSAAPQKLPLTPDIMLFKDYCYQVAADSEKILKENVENIDSLKKLSEAVLALTILLNRKRVGDVQYMHLEVYCKCPTNNNEECLNILTEDEKELARYFKRVVSIGKGSKSIPILFPKPIQKYIEIMLDVRKRTSFIPKENPYLFALCKSPSKWINGSSVLRKYAVLCGAKNPNTLSSSRLRKQIATVLQILNLNQIEMEQIATFMGHTKKTHEEFYRLPQEIYQTSKIAKLLLMMEKGINKEDEGKTLNDLENVLETLKDNDHNVPSNQGNHATPPEEHSEQDEGDEPKSGRSNIPMCTGDPSLLPEVLSVKPRNTVQEKSNCRGSWNIKQKNILLTYFKKHIKNKISPKKAECLEFQQKNIALFKGKTWLQIKVFVYNTFRMK